jgi:hypothetical protein
VWILSEDFVTRIIICSRVIGIEPLSYANGVEMTNWATSLAVADLVDLYVVWKRLLYGGDLI